MESVLASRSLAEESLQMWDLNKRLEAYLARVKFLEEENEVLKGEVQRLRGSPTQASWRAKCEEQVAAWRAHLDEAFREKHVAELGRAGLCEEVQQVKGRCQKERAAREEAQKLLALSRKELEEEKRSHIWLREKAAQLEKEAEALVAAHQEERARLEQEAAGFTCSLEGGPGTPVAFRAVEVEDYSTRLSDIWRGAVETYKTEVSQLEASFGEVKESLWKATQGNQKAQLQLQSMERELAGLEARKQALEEHLAQQWQLQQGEAEKLQMAVEGLEEEKQALAVQIAQVLEDRRQLMHLKVSLSLEVATYRTLLEAESTRLQVPGDHRVAVRPPDSKLEASKSKRQAVSLERRPLGPQDPRLNSTPFLKGGVAPPLPTDPSGPFAVGIISVLPRSRSPVVREPQRAAAPVLQAQLAQALEGGDAPAFTDATAFQSSSSRQSKAGAASTAGRASQSSVQESPPPFSANSPLLPNVLGASSSSPPPGERREELSAQVGMRMLGRKAGLHQEVEEEEEEEEEPTEEPPWETPEHHHVPYPSQLVTEALEIALQEVRLGEGRFAAGLLGVAEAPSGIPPPPDHSSSVEEGNGAAAASPGTPEEATLELHRRQAEERLSAGLPEGNRGPEDASEANGGPEVCSEQQGEGGVWGSWGAEPPSLQETQLLEEGGSPSAQHNTEGVASDIPVAGKADCCHERRVPEQMQGGRGQPPGAQSIIQRHEPEEGSRGAQSASQLGVDSAAAAAAVLRADQESPSLPADQSGATGPDVEEADGGVEDLEVVSTEALHLSEDEEQRTLSSPSRESEEGDFQAEMLDREFLQTEEFAAETLSPGSHSFYHQQLHFLGAQQEAPEEEASLSQTDFAFPEEEGTQADSTPETSSAEGAVLREGPPAGALSSDPRPMGEEEEEEADVEEHCIWEPQQDIRGGGDFLEEDGAVGEEGTMEKKERATLPHWTPEQPTVLQQENVGSVLRQEISTGEETADGCQGDLPMQQQREEEEIDTKGNQGEQTVEGCQEDLPVGQQMEGEDITTKGKQAAETLEAYQEVLPMEQQMEGEDITMKREQGEKTVEGCQEDLPVEQQTEEVDITTKTDLREGPVEAYQEVLSMQQQMEEEDITTKGDQAEQTVEECQEVLPLEQQIEEEDITTKEDQAEQTVEECQEDLPVEQLMEEEDIITKGVQAEQTAEECQEDLPVEQQTEEVDIPMKTDLREGPVEAYQEVLSMQQQMEEEDITTKGVQAEQTAEECQEDLPVEQLTEEVDIPTKTDLREGPVEAYQEVLSMQQQMEEEDITTKRVQAEQTVEECQEDLPVEQQTEEVDIPTKTDLREGPVEAYQEVLSMQQQMEEEDITTKGDQAEQTAEECQEDLPVEQQMEGEDITTKGKQAAETLEVCQEVLPMEQQMEGGDITTKGVQAEQRAEECQEDLPVEQQTEDVDIPTKTDLREGPVEAYQEVLSMQQQMEEEDITTKGDQAEQTVEECQEVLPLEQQIEEEDITTKEDQAEQTVEECQEDLPVEQLMEEKESRGEPTVETCQGDVSVEEQVQLQEEGIPPQGEQPVEVCQGDLAVQQQREEGETPVASPGRERLKREGLTAESEAVQAAETEPKTSLVGVAGPVSCVGTSDVQEKENPEPHPVSTADPSQAGEREEPGPSPLPLRLEHSLPQEASAGPPEVPSGAQGHTAHGAEAESCGGPPEMALSSESDLRLPSGHSGAEASPDASCDSEGTGKELEGSRHVELEETLPDQTPLHLYGGGRLLMPGQGPLPPENEGAAEAALPCAQDGLASAEAAEQVEEVEEAEGPYRPRAERDGAEALEGVGEERDTTEAAPKHNASFHAEGLPASEGLEEAKAETLGLARGLEGGLRTAAGERPCVPDSFPPGAAEAEGLLSHGRGAGEGLAGGEVALEEASRTGFVWGTEGDSVFQPDQLGPSVLPEGFPGGRDSPWEFCEPRPVVSEGSHKVSPLTSVADLGEIVLEEEQSPGSHDDGAESEGLANGGDGSGPCGRAAQPPAPGLGSCGREEPAPQAGWPGLGPGGVALAEPPAGSWKDSDILEIVEQALEFNQEVIKAAEQTAGAEEWAARGEHHHQSSLPFPGAGRSRVPAETPNAPSPDGPPRLWAENNANGLKQDSSLADFTTEILNGIGGLHPDISGPDAGPFREEPVEEEAVDQPFCRQGLDDPSPLRTRDQNPSQAPANEEAPRTGGISSETQEKDALEHQGQEGSGPEKSPFASRMPPAHGRGKEVEREAVSVPPRFGEDILHLEPIQILKFRPEEEEERWSPGDN